MLLCSWLFLAMLFVVRLSSPLTAIVSFPSLSFSVRKWSLRSSKGTAFLCSSPMTFSSSESQFEDNNVDFVHVCEC